MVLGVALLGATFLIDSYHQQGSSEEFNYAYIPGIAMLFVFMYSFFLFHKQGSSKSK